MHIELTVRYLSLCFSFHRHSHPFLLPLSPLLFSFFFAFKENSQRYINAYIIFINPIKDEVREREGERRERKKGRGEREKEKHTKEASVPRWSFQLSAPLTSLHSVLFLSLKEREREREQCRCLKPSECCFCSFKSLHTHTPKLGGV